MRVLVFLSLILGSVSFSAFAAVDEEIGTAGALAAATDDVDVSEIELPEDLNPESLDLWDVYFVDEEQLSLPLEELTDLEIFGDRGLIYELEELEQTAAAGKAKSKKKLKKRRSGRSCVAGNGRASWYGPGFNGRKTASGERFNQNALTAAHKTLRFGALVRVTYRGKSVVVRVNDHGPHVRGRVIDLSKAAAKAIGLLGAGSGPVSLQIVRCG